MKMTSIKFSDENNDKTIDLEEKSKRLTDVDESNPYSYTKRAYTTEIFKIEIDNLPFNTNYAAFIKFLKKKKHIKYSKVKVCSSFDKQTSHAYVTLKSDAERIRAAEILNGLAYRGNEMIVKDSNPLPDPLLAKRRRQDDESKFQQKISSNVDEDFDALSKSEKEERINNQVASLWKTPYEEQLKVKLSSLQNSMNKWHQELKILAKNFRLLPEVQKILDTLRKNIEQLNEVDQIVRSPVINGYRNKCEFNVGSDLTVGFRLGLYKQGSVRVVTPSTSCPILSSQMHQILQAFQSYLLLKSKLSGFDPITRQGHWRQITVRTTRSISHCQIILTVYRQNLTDHCLQEEFKLIKQHFNQIKSLNISIYTQVIDDSCSQAQSHKNLLNHLDGPEHVFETLKLPNQSELKFRISPLSFFQTNTDGAEVLYQTISQLAECDKNTIVLDICCGTGTIGLFLAQQVKRVLGFELNEASIADARFNAKHNQIDNVEYHCGRAEKLLGTVLNQLPKNENTEEDQIIAILDPPRNGLPVSIIKTIRKNFKIRRLIYLSCEALSAKQNFVDLCRPRSNAYNGAPFVPMKLIPVDMFPHTDKCELVILFERNISRNKES